MSPKEFPTLAVMGVYSGLVLEEKGFGGIHEVMDHFYPGIMTVGVAAMSKDAAEEIAFQLPRVKDVPGDPSDWKTYAAKCLEVLGPTLTLEGPLKVSEGEIKRAFEDFGKAHP